MSDGKCPQCGLYILNSIQHAIHCPPPKPETVYLCGPIAGCTDEECKNWRDQVKLVLPSTLDPMRRDYRGREGGCEKEIVEGDKADIDQCGALLVNYDKPSVGTSMEVLYAWERKKFIIIVARPDTKLSPWLVYHSSMVVSTFGEACAVLKARPTPKP